MTRPPMLAADHINELIHPFTTTERVTQPHQGPDGTWRPKSTLHHVTHPCLLDQLEHATNGATNVSDDDATRGAFASKPATHLDALDVLARIDHESTTLAAEHEIPALPLRDRLSRISGKVGDRTHPVVKRWWVSARLATHWDSPPFRPAGAPCPACWETKGLRIHLVDRLARCVECGQTWEGPGVSVLAQHVRWCTDHEVTKARHWLHDAQGELVECTECLAFRDGYVAWRMSRDTRAAVVVDRVAAAG